MRGSFAVLLSSQSNWRRVLLRASVRRRPESRPARQSTRVAEVRRTGKNSYLPELAGGSDCTSSPCIKRIASAPSHCARVQWKGRSSPRLCATDLSGRACADVVVGAGLAPCEWAHRTLPCTCGSVSAISWLEDSRSRASGDAPSEDRWTRIRGNRGSRQPPNSKNAAFGKRPRLVCHTKPRGQMKIR